MGYGRTVDKEVVSYNPQKTPTFPGVMPLQRRKSYILECICHRKHCRIATPFGLPDDLPGAYCLPNLNNSFGRQLVNQGKSAVILRSGGLRLVAGCVFVFNTGVDLLPWH